MLALRNRAGGIPGGDGVKIEHAPVRIALRCSCGNSADGLISASGESRFRQIWFEAHSGPNHVTTDRSHERKVDLAAALFRDTRA